MSQEGLEQRLQCLEDMMLHHQELQVLRETRLFKYLNGKIDLLKAAIPNIDHTALRLKIARLHQELKEQGEKDDEEAAKEYDRMRKNATITTSQAKDRSSDTETFVDHLKELFVKTDYVCWADIYKQLEDAATNGEKYTTFTENFRAVRDLVEAAGLQYENGKHEVQFIKVWGWA